MSCAISRSVVSLPPDIVSRPVDAVARRVVDDRVGAADVARVLDLLGLGVLEQRPDAGPDAQRARLAEARDQPLAVVEHLVDLLLRDRDLVRVGGADVGRADHADGADRDEDVAVGRHRAAVDHRVHEPVVHRDHDPLAGDHADVLDPGHVDDLRRPRARGVEHEAGLDVEVLAGLLVAHARARDRVARPVQVDHAVVREDRGRRARPRRGRTTRPSSTRRSTRRGR